MCRRPMAGADDKGGLGNEALSKGEHRPLEQHSDPARMDKGEQERGEAHAQRVERIGGGAWAQGERGWSRVRADASGMERGRSRSRVE